MESNDDYFAGGLSVINFVPVSSTPTNCAAGWRVGQASWPHDDAKGMWLRISSTYGVRDLISENNLPFLFQCLVHPSSEKIDDKIIGWFMLQENRSVLHSFYEHSPTLIYGAASKVPYRHEIPQLSRIIATIHSTKNRLRSCRMQSHPRTTPNHLINFSSSHMKHRMSLSNSHRGPHF